MTKPTHSPTIHWFFVGMLVLAATSSAQTPPPVAKQIARTYGVDSFEQIEAIRYTYNVQLGTLNVVHSWVWQPKSEQVSYEGRDKNGNPVKVIYVRSQLDSAPTNVKEEIDPAFLDSQYWLIFPLHVYWDTFADVKDLGTQKLPLGEGSAKRVAVKYPDGGYSPGDTWELFVRSDGRVEELMFHRGGAAKPSLVKTSWADHKKAGPLLIAMDHRGTADGQPLRLFFTNVSVKLVGSDNWIDAQ